MRFAGWPPPLNVTVTPQTASPVFIGNYLLEEGQDTIWVKVTSSTEGDTCIWPYSYALFTWVSSEGRELGTVKIHGVCEGEVYRLTVGRTPLQRAGELYLYPRTYNLRWIDKGNPWTLGFQVVSGISGSGPPPDLGGGTLGSFTPDNGKAELDFTFDDIFAGLILRFILK